MYKNNEIWKNNGVKMEINELFSDYYRICCRINVLGIHNKNTQIFAIKQNIFGVNGTMKLTTQH